MLRGRVRRGGRRSHALGLIDLIESFGSKDLFLLCAEPEELLPLDSGPLYYVTSDDSEDERSESLGWKRMEVGFMKRDDSELRILMDACRSRGIHAMALVVGSTSNGDQRKKAMEIADALDEYMELRADRNASWSIPPSWDAVFGTETLPNHSEMYG